MKKTGINKKEGESIKSAYRKLVKVSEKENLNPEFEHQLTRINNAFLDLLSDAGRLL